MTHMGKTPPPKGPGFEPTLRQIPIAAILPVKQLPTTVPKGQKYAQIAASIREAGLIEPLVVARAPGQDGTFILLDGHVRLHVLKEMGEETVTLERVPRALIIRELLVKLSSKIVPNPIWTDLSHVIPPPAASAIGKLIGTNPFRHIQKELAEDAHLTGNHPRRAAHAAFGVARHRAAG